MSEQNGGQESRRSQRLDRMEDVIQSMITLNQQQHELAAKKHEWVAKKHELVMEELHEMRDLQKEMRMDIMALFQVNENLRRTMQQYFERPA